MESRPLIVNFLLKFRFTPSAPRSGDARQPTGVDNERVHATVATFSPASRAGTVLLDDGSELPFDAAAFDAGGLRLLRPGQRVTLGMDEETVTAITIATFPLP